MRSSKRLKTMRNQYAETEQGRDPGNRNRSLTRSPSLNAAPQEVSHAPPYTTISSEQGDIRLLKLAPGRFEDQLVISLVKSNLLQSAEQTYEALSYVWGTEISDKKALLDGVPVSITANLDCALRHLRYTIITRTLWVDALAMNQSDVQERNHQVQMMGKIYSTAKRVMVWLGPVDENDLKLKVVLGAMQFQFANPSPSIATLFDYMCSIFALFDQQVGRTQDCKECTLDTISRIIERPWFQRVWVVQELALSQVATVRIGTYTFPWEPFQQFINWLPYHRADPGVHPKFCEMAVRVTRASTQSEFSSQLCRTIHLSATDPRDKVFSLLGISKTSDTSIVADYAKSTAEVYIETTAMMLRQNDFRIYLYAPLQPLRGQHVSRTTTSLPSWVPDLRIANAAFGSLIETIVATSHGSDTYHRPTTMLSGLLGVSSILQQFHKICTSSPGCTTDTSPTCNAMLSTRGRYIGTIAKTSGNLLNSLDEVNTCSGLIKSMYDIYTNVVAPCGGKAVDLIRTLRGNIITKASVSTLFLEWLVHEVEGHSGSIGEARSSFRTSIKEFNMVVSATVRNRVIFVTTNGVIGVSYHPDLNGIRPGDQLVGLFGINFPFILRRNTIDNTWQMINVAGFAGHTWGHGFSYGLSADDSSSESLSDVESSDLDSGNYPDNMGRRDQVWDDTTDKIESYDSELENSLEDDVSSMGSSDEWTKQHGMQQYLIV